jgi:HlyD family secretion protein
VDNNGRKRGRVTRWVIIIAAVALVAGAGTVYLTVFRSHGTEPKYQVAQIQRGDLENTVTCTGALSAVGTVEIGTQVSGIVANVFVDFNDHVKKDQILAVLDTTLLAAAVIDARAGLLNARAQYDQAEAEYQRNLPLSEKGYISEQEFLPLKTAVTIREASLQSATASLDRAQANLRNAVIRSPIEGSVIQRAVEPGQTVAASFSTPTLFVIAKDLSEMEILVAVDESDIGQVKEGQEARFTVQGYPDETFEGTVRQIRLQPESVQNVVTYTVVVRASNDKGLLLPGMTATVDLVIERREGVLLVPNSALRITPSAEMMAEARRQMQERSGVLPDSAGRTVGKRAENAPSGSSPMPGDHKVIWTLDEGGRVSMKPVRTGATDGKMTEITSSQGIEEGTTIIVGLNGSSTGSSGSTSQSTNRNRPPGFRMF